jgi:hypothetical protein
MGGVNDLEELRKQFCPSFPRHKSQQIAKHQNNEIDARHEPQPSK